MPNLWPAGPVPLANATVVSVAPEEFLVFYVEIQLSWCKIAQSGNYGFIILFFQKAYSTVFVYTVIIWKRA